MTAMTDGQLGILAANVRAVPESLRYDETLEDYTIFQDFGLPPAYQPAQVPQLGDAREGECAPWDYVVTATGSALAAKAPDYGAYLTGVQYQKPKRPYDTGISAVSGTATAVGASTLSTGLTWAANLYVDYAINIVTATAGAGQWRPILSHTTAGVVTVAKAWDPLPTGTITYKIWAMTEIERKPLTGRKGRHLGTRTFLCVDSVAEALAESMFPELTPMAATGNWQYALLREKQVERRWRVGLAKITCQYDSYAPIGETIVINKGILECEASTIVLWNNDVVPDTDPAVRIDQVYYKDVEGKGRVPMKWVKVLGNNGKPLTRAIFQIRALLDTSNLNAVRALVGLINSNTCTNIFGVTAGKLWFNRFNFYQRKWGTGLLFDCIMGLAYDPAGWDTRTQVQLQKYDIERSIISKVDGTPSEQSITTAFWMPDNPTGALTDMPFTDSRVSFALLDGYLA